MHACEMCGSISWRMAGPVHSCLVFSLACVHSGDHNGFHGGFHGGEGSCDIHVIVCNWEF